MTRHSDLIAEQQRLDPAWQQRRFRKTAMALIRKANASLGKDNEMPDLIESIERDLSFVPDLYYVADSPPTIAICEVECAHRVPAHKRDAIAFIGDHIEGLGIALRVLIVDAHGGRTEVNWQAWYSDWVCRNARELYPDAPALQQPKKALPAKRRPGRQARPARTLDEIIDASIARRQKRRGASKSQG